jgi:hypothetical protein
MCSKSQMVDVRVVYKSGLLYFQVFEHYEALGYSTKSKPVLTFVCESMAPLVPQMFLNRFMYHFFAC